jgi:hypothetical protein
MYHELMHIVVVDDPKKGLSVKIAPHDIQDFHTIIQTYGIDWFLGIKELVASTYEMQGAEKDQISV